jgi:cytochrome c biogenesis protein CcmG/thiol:disulfide interchange protein DsbE
VSETVTEQVPDAGSNGSPRHRRVAPFVALAVAVLIAGLFVVLAGADESVNETAETPLMDQPAPDAVGRRADGSEFDLARRKGSWVVLNYFTSDCVPCQQEHPELVRFAEQQEARGDAGAELYTVVYDDERDRVDAFFAERGGDWDIVYDPDGSFSVAFGVSKVPETWIVDPDGYVRFRAISRVTADFLAARLEELQAVYG